jgi:hypothetical protein
MAVWRDGAMRSRERVMWLIGALALLLVGSVSVTACSNAGENRVLAVSGAGFVGGVVYLDVDGNRQPGGPDNGLPNVRVRLIVAGTRDTVAQASSDANGTFVFGSVPVGRYTVVVPPEAAFGDTISVVRIDTSAVTLSPGDTAQVQVAVSYPSATVREARALPLGTKVFVEGVALNTVTTFGDSTVSVEDTSGALRATDVRGPLVALGDSVRFLGTMTSRDGQPVLGGAQATVLLNNRTVVAQTVTTAAAATADGGRLDAALVTVLNATVGADTATVDNDYVFTIDDGSGPLTVVLDQSVPISPAPYVPGVVLTDATGVLVPDGLGAWRLKPRTGTDLHR